MDGPSGLLAYIFNRLKTKRRCLIVYSEGAGYAMMDKQMPDSLVDHYGNHKDFVETYLFLSLLIKLGFWHIFIGLNFRILCLV